jgi:Ni/Co efflux regulator RcnB
MESAMKRLLLAASVAFALLPALAFASPAPAGRGSDQHWSPQHRGDRGHDRNDHDSRYSRDHRPRDRRPVVVVHHDNGRHEGWYKQSWRRGQRVPVVYLQPRYYISDYRHYGLAPPPRGYRWVRPYPDSGEYLLVAVATGLIAQVLGY